jgi:hypothetical protein
MDVLCSALSVAVLGVLIAACGGDDSSTTGGGHETSFGEELAIAACDKLFECCNAPDLVERVGNAPIVDYAGCHILYSALWRAGYEPILRESEAAGRLTVDRSRFDGCIGAIRAQSCADFSASVGITGCEEAFVPKVEAGGACSIDIECTTGSCEIPTGASEGSCVQAPPLAGLNEPCASGDDCESGLYCTAAACAMKKADGGACSGNDECQSGVCVGDSQGPGQCGTVCEGGGSGSGPIDRVLADISVPLVAAQCDKPVECCTTAELEQLWPPGLTTKADCYGLNSALAGLSLVQIHNHAAEGKVAIDGAALNACVDAAAALSCQDYSRAVDLSCPEGIKGLVAEGNACTEHNVCASTYCHEPMPDQGTCAALPAAGAPCTGKCAEGLYCDAGTCAAQKATGTACTANAECLEGRCVGPMPGSRTCSLICDGM